MDEKLIKNAFFINKNTFVHFFFNFHNRIDTFPRYCFWFQFADPKMPIVVNSIYSRGASSVWIFFFLSPYHISCVCIECEPSCKGIRNLINVCDDFIFYFLFFCLARPLPTKKKNYINDILLLNSCYLWLTVQKKSYICSMDAIVMFEYILYKKHKDTFLLSSKIPNS